LDAIRHSSLGFVRMLGKAPHDMFVDGCHHRRVGPRSGRHIGRREGVRLW
jgi:hypothetical protein